MNLNTVVGFRMQKKIKMQNEKIERKRNNVKENGQEKKQQETKTRKE
jgi:hypothetical protein